MASPRAPLPSLTISKKSWLRNLYTQSKVLISENHKHRKLDGVIGTATDDMIHGGGQYHTAKMAAVQQKYKLGNFQHDEGKFCGKDIRMKKDGSILINQAIFAKDKVTDIPINKERRTRYSFCIEEEISQLRTFLGSFAWLAKKLHQI